MPWQLHFPAALQITVCSGGRCVSVCSRSVVSDSLQPHSLQPTRLLCPWDFPGRNTGVGCYFLLQEICPTQGLKLHLLHLLHWQVDSFLLCHLGSPNTMTGKISNDLNFTRTWHPPGLSSAPQSISFPLNNDASAGRWVGHLLSVWALWEGPRWEVNWKRTMLVTEKTTWKRSENGQTKTVDSESTGKEIGGWWAKKCSHSEIEVQDKQITACILWPRPGCLHGEWSWALKNWCFWTMVLEKTLESPLDCKEIQPVHPKGDQSWVFIGRTDVEAETPILWPPDAKSWLIWKDPDGKDWR